MAIDYITRDDATLIKVEQHDEDDAFDYTLMTDGEVHKKLISGHHLIDPGDRDAIYDDFILLKQSVDDFYDNDTLSDLKNDNRVLAHHIVNFLSANKVTNSKQFQEMQERFLEQLEKTDQTLAQLDSKVAYLNKVLGALSDYQDGLVPSEVTMAILEKAKVAKHTDRNLIRKEIKELQIEREALQEARDRIVKDYDFSHKLTQEYTPKESRKKSVL